MRDVKEYLTQKRSGNEPLSADWATMADLYDKRLWHQLTLKLIDFVKNEYFSTKGGLLDLYENFLSDFENKINPLSLMEIVMFVVKEIQDPEKAIEFLNSQKEKVKGNNDAQVLCLTAIGNLKLTQKKLPETKAIIEDVNTLLENVEGITTVHARFYNLSSSYDKAVGSFNEYYRNALRFLGCVDVAELPVKELQERAFNLALAALLGSDVYNFGELLAHPILDSIKGSEHRWIVDLLYAFNSGDIAKFELSKSTWTKQPDLASHAVLLRQKITLLCLMEMAFNRPPNNRSLSFKEIATEAKIPLNEVELLVMKALSIGLVKGSIDEVNQMVQMSWVQPRVLDRKQFQDLNQEYFHGRQNYLYGCYCCNGEMPTSIMKIYLSSLGHIIWTGTIQENSCLNVHPERHVPIVFLLNHPMNVRSDQLFKSQISNMKDRLSEWCDKTKNTSYMVEDQVPELLV